MAREEEGELLHGLARERSVWREWEGERGLGDGSQVKRGRADEWGPRVGRGAQKRGRADEWGLRVGRGAQTLRA